MDAQEHSPEQTAAELWDAGDMGCGELIVLLLARMRRLPPGGMLHLIAQDLGAKEDLPAWCGMTGHILHSAVHPQYWIERRRD